MAGWYTKNVDTYFAGRSELLAQVLHGNTPCCLDCQRIPRAEPPSGANGHS
jgi:hypothetical protein